MAAYNLHEQAASIIRDAGGELVGRTRLQKVVYLTQLAGWPSGFEFEYRHYGPFSEDLADAVKIATGLKMVREEEKATEWGGWFSTFRAREGGHANPERAAFVTAAAKMGAIELELAATAAFLSLEEGYADPWEETARRKPDKASRIDAAKVAYDRLRKIDTPTPLPNIEE